MAEVHGHTGLLVGLLRSGVTGDEQVLLFLDLLPVVDSRTEAAPVCQGLGQCQPVEHDVDVSRVGGVTHLVGDVERVVDLLAVRQLHVDAQQVFSRRSGGRTEGQEICRDGGLPVVCRLKREGHRMARRLAGAKQKSVGQARQRTAEATRTAEVTEVGDIAYFHGVPADRGSGAEDDTPLVRAVPDGECLEPVGPYPVGGVAELFAVRPRQLPRHASAGTGTDGVEAVSVFVMQEFRVAVDTHGAVVAGGQPDAASVNVGELVDKRLSPAFGEEVDLHGRRVRIGRTAPVEHHLHIVRLQAAAAEVLVFTAGKQHGEQGQQDVQVSLHRLPPFLIL